MTTVSSFRINQPPGTPYANWDRARRDIALGAVECEALNKSELSYKWEMFSAPFGVTVVINNDTTHTCDFTLATRGGYLIRLTVNEGLMNESMTTLYIGIPLPYTNLCIPAANETNQDNSQVPYTGERGWSDKLEAFIRAIDINIVGQAIGKIKQVVETIGATSNETGEIDLGLAEGQIYQVFATVTGSSTDCNIEFSASVYGEPDNQYEIGQDDEGVTLWNPSSDGDWNDRNAWGFHSLVDGKLYYRFTNNGISSIVMTVQIRAIGFENALV